MNKLYYSLPFVLLLSAFYALRDDVNTYISTMWVGELLSYVSKACTNSSLFNILLALTLCCFFLIIGKKIYHSKGCIFRSCCILFAISYLYTNNYWVFSKTYFFNIGYDTLLIISSIIIFITDTIAIARRCHSEDNTDTFIDDMKGYCMDQIYAKYRDTGWDNYVDDLLALMPRERLKRESLAIGISGNWGSGKTSFLKTMQNSMGSDYRVVSFNPWTCTDKEQIVSKFFTLMRKQTEDDDESLRNAIQKYRDIVLDVDIHPSITLLAKIFPKFKEKESLESLKDKIEKAISSDGSKPFAIFVDDLDRLEGDELFEVLRLIRVTANFRNVVFVVAYDRNYICNVLNESKNIKRAEEYLQKIFHLEVSLPKFEDETLLDVFMEEVSRIEPLVKKNEVKVRQYIVQLCDSAGVSFTDFIPNFRQARRFANIFALNLKAIFSHTKNFIIRDFFGIELLHFAFPEVHHQLMYKPMTLLKQRPKALSKSKLLVYEGEENTCWQKLLKALFSKESETGRTPREIRSLLSYANYFCYRLPKNVIGFTEFESVMIEEELEDVRDRINHWMQTPAFTNSLFDHFMSYHMHGYRNEKVIRNYICALLEFLPCLTEHSILQISSDRYWIRTGVNLCGLRSEVISLFESSIGKGLCLEKINTLLTTFYHPFMVDDDPEEIPIDLLTISELDRLAEMCLVKYIEQQKEKPSPCEISKKNSPFNTFLKSGVYIESYYNDGERLIDNFSNLMCRELIRQYEGVEADLLTFREFIEPYIIKTDDPSDEEYEAQTIKHDIELIFGNFKLFEEFVHKTFSPNEEIERNLKYIRNIMISTH